MLKLPVVIRNAPVASDRKELTASAVKSSKKTAGGFAFLSARLPVVRKNVGW